MFTPKTTERLHGLISRVIVNSRTSWKHQRNKARYVERILRYYMTIQFGCCCCCWSNKWGEGRKARFRFEYYFFIIIVVFLWSFVRCFCDHHSRQYHPAFDDGDGDDDRDGATEVQTNFYHSQYYTVITTKSKIKILLLVVGILARRKLNFSIVLYYNKRILKHPAVFCLPYTSVISFLNE